MLHILLSSLHPGVNKQFLLSGPQGEELEGDGQGDIFECF